MPAEAVFLDAAYAIALAVPEDEFHPKAAALAREMQLRRTPMITTEAILLEIGDALGRPKFRLAGVKLIRAILRDRQILVIPLTRGLVEQALELFGQRHDKGWGLTDCLSFVVMKEHDLREALTTDDHFEQAGFVALLRR